MCKGKNSYMYYTFEGVNTKSLKQTMQADQDLCSLHTTKSYFLALSPNCTMYKENMSFEFVIGVDSNQPARLKRLARILKRLMW